jgi:hypothetical protein
VHQDIRVQGLVDENNQHCDGVSPKLFLNLNVRFLIEISTFLEGPLVSAANVA